MASANEVPNVSSKSYMYEQPSYPVVKSSPTLDDCIKSMRLFREGLQVGGITGASWAYGYIFGRPVRFATANTVSVMGFTFATFYVVQNARFRLKGLSPNANEVAQFGIQSPAVKPIGSNPTLDRYPTANLPENEIDWMSYKK